MKSTSKALLCIFDKEHAKQRALELAKTGAITIQRWEAEAGADVPTANQIRYRFGSWGAFLAYCGVEASPHAQPYRPHWRKSRHDIARIATQEAINVVMSDTPLDVLKLFL